MPPPEAIAIARLRTWAARRIQTQSGRIAAYRRTGWQQRETRMFDARIVAQIDFERALGTLDCQEQIALVLRYRDHAEATEIALAIGCSASKVKYLIPRARRQLADALDRRNLL